MLTKIPAAQKKVTYRVYSTTLWKVFVSGGVAVEGGDAPAKKCIANFLPKQANSGLTPSTRVPYLFKISLNIGRAEGNAMPVVTLDHQGKPISVKTLKEPRWGEIEILDYKAPNDA